MSELKSYKKKQRIISSIDGLIAVIPSAIVILVVIEGYLPSEYVAIIPPIIAVMKIINQIWTEKRVVRAEDIEKEKQFDEKQEKLDKQKEDLIQYASENYEKEYNVPNYEEEGDLNLDGEEGA